MHRIRSSNPYFFENGRGRFQFRTPVFRFSHSSFIKIRNRFCQEKSPETFIIYSPASGSGDACGAAAGFSEAGSGCTASGAADSGRETEVAAGLASDDGFF